MNLILLTGMFYLSFDILAMYKDIEFSYQNITSISESLCRNLAVKRSLKVVPILREIIIRMQKTAIKNVKFESSF